MPGHTAGTSVTAHKLDLLLAMYSRTYSHQTYSHCRLTPPQSDISLYSKQPMNGPVCTANSPWMVSSVQQTAHECPVCTANSTWMVLSVQQTENEWYMQRFSCGHKGQLLATYNDWCLITRFVKALFINTLCTILSRHDAGPQQGTPYRQAHCWIPKGNHL